jgi:hypothetical protein
MRVSGGRVVLKRFVVGDVIGFGAERQRAGFAGPAQGFTDVVRRAALRRAVGPAGGGLETTLEVTPRDALRVKQITDVLVVGAELHLVSARAVVTEGLRIVDKGPLAVTGVVYDHVRRERLPAWHEFGCHSVGLARYQVDVTGRRRSERGVVEVVAHRIVLSVVPQRGHRVAVVVGHHQTRGVKGRW